MELTVRPARADDYAVYVRLFGELGIPDPVPRPERFAEGIVPVMRVACTAAGDVIGFATWRAYGVTAHVMQLVVDPALRGQRIGERLLHHIGDDARAAGCTHWYLNVKRDNHAAIRLYERCGFAFELEAVTMKLAWANVPSVDAPPATAAPSDDVAIANRFRLPVERIAAFRARASYRLVIVREQGEVVAFAAFDPSFPGAATFCATRPALAVPLLAAMRHHADPQYDFVRVTVEGDRALADAVLALGAELTFEILRLSAALG